MAFAALVALATTVTSQAGVLSPSDAQKVEDLRPTFLKLMTDLSQTSKRTDISPADAECIKSTIDVMLQVSQELSSYEYLITIEKDLNDFGDNSPMRDVLKFAIDKSTAILAGERKRLMQVPDQCARLPLASGKNQQALQFVDTTSGILRSIRF